MKNKGKDKSKPDVKIFLDKWRTIRFDLNAMVRLEEMTGKSLFDGTFLSSDMSAKDIRAVLWACLSGEDSELTIEQVGSWISVSNMAEVASKLSEAFEAAMPDGKGEEVPLAEKPRSG